MLPRLTIGFIFAVGFLFGCEGRFPLSSLPDPGASFVVGDTAYIEISPSFEGFNEPRALLIGNDQLLYVADTRNNRIVMMNLAGQLQGQRTILRPLCIAQDFRLDLLVGGAMVAATGDTIGAIFRIKMVASQHSLATARVDTVWKEPARPRRRFVGIGVLPDNQYLVARTGPDNSSFIDPDARVLLFNANDVFQTPLADLVTRAGSGITDINFPTNIAAFPNSRDFILTQRSEGIAYGALWMVYQQTADFEGWQPRFDPARPEHRTVDFVRPNRFVEPVGVAFDGRRRDIFVVDAALDSVIKFDSRGRFRIESFGFAKSGGRLQKPSGIAFFDRTLYISDLQTNRIYRFRLSTDF
jgi:hypothetical protein